ncbi:MAG: NUDIX domain-containing protein [Chlamydiae bacterium]|nr:NUDIX domain-containing protein [Chlamydiota bacterium]
MMQQTEDYFHLGAKALLRNHEGKLLLLKKEHKVRGVYWDIPGGRLQKEESLMQALQRELEEETGLKHLQISRVVPFVMVLTNIRIPIQDSHVGLILSIYLYDLQAAFTPILSIEHTDFGWFSQKEAAELLKHQYPLDMIDRLGALTQNPTKIVHGI